MTQTPSNDIVAYVIKDQIAHVTVANPPVNALSQGVRSGILAAIEKAEADSDVRAVVLICAGRTFFAGADIREFALPVQSPQLAEVIDAIESASKPVIAAIHGNALGGGLELALGCHYRIADSDARLGLPEVKLGLIPGAGGTQRLPRLVDTATALDMIVNGDSVTAKRALDIGLVDEVTQDDLGAAAHTFAERVAAQSVPLRRVSALPVPPLESAVFDRMQAEVQSRKRGFEAPARCIEAVRAALTQPFAQGLAAESALFAELKASPQSRALRHAFFAEREAAKLPFEAQAQPIAQAAVIGAGTMGAGIAMCFANAGIPVILLEKEAERLAEGLARIRGNYASTVRRGRLSEQALEQRMACIEGATTFEALANADIVIEAVFEDMAVKHEVFKTLDRVCKPGAILASNTSYLDIDRIASVTARPEDVVGMHFFSPANVMRLLENVRGPRTSARACATAMAVGRKLGKVCVLVGSCDGFVGNRMLSKRTRESYFMLQEGASPYQIDAVLRDFGLPMGPFAMADLAGLDVGWRNRQGRLDTLTPRERDCDILDRMVQAKRLGQKTGGGFYDYDAQRKATPSTDAQAIIAAHRKTVDIEQRVISDQEILERCLYSMINEAAYILEEKMVTRASDIDVVWLNGYGFPAYRGGPLFYADQIGLDTVLAGVRKYEALHGSVYWKPAGLLVELAESGRGFYETAR